MTTNIYVLQLEGGKWYVGKSNNIVSRLKEHLSGTGSVWTKKYRPISVHKTLENVSAFEEDKVTKEYMAKYGIDRVRGGTYVAETLDPAQVDSLNKEIWAATDCCTNCGRKGHFVKDCVAKTDVNGGFINPTSLKFIGGGFKGGDPVGAASFDYVWECGVCKREFLRENECLAHERGCRPVYANPFRPMNIKNGHFG
jgi:predicted GIY-YIG superfamily endonuclease